MRWYLIFIFYFPVLVSYAQMDFRMKSFDRDLRSISKNLSIDKSQKSFVEDVLKRRWTLQNQIDSDKELEQVERFLIQSSIYFSSFAELKEGLNEQQKEKLAKLLVTREDMLRDFLASSFGKNLTKEEIYRLNMSWKNGITPNNKRN
jgi:signal recognition particle GTPase